MKHVLLVLALLSVIGCGPSPNVAESATTITAPDAMSRTCATGFVRASPNFCIANPLITKTIPISSPCNTVSVAEVPSSASFLDVQFQATMKSGGTPILNNTQLSIYTTNTCITTYEFFYITHYEYALIAAGLWTGDQNINMKLPWALFQSKVNYTTNLVSGSSLQALEMSVYGYYD